MHVLFLPSFYPTAERPTSGVFFREQARALQYVGVQVGVAYPETRSLRTIGPRALRDSHFQVVWEDDGGIRTVRRRGWNTLMQTSIGAGFWIRQMVALCRHYTRMHGAPDVLHAHNALWAGAAAIAVSHEGGAPFVITEHSSAIHDRAVTPHERAVAARVYSAAKRVVCVSEALARQVAQFGMAVRAQVIPNVVDTEFFVPPAVPRSTEQFVFVAIGNLTPNKSFDSIIRAFACRFGGAADVRLVIGGDGPMRSELQGLAEGLGVGPHVQYLGPLSRAGVRLAMWTANCFVLASRSETFGVVLIEALSTGIPVISTRSGGPEDIVQSGIGALVEPGDESALGEAMVAARRSPINDPSTLRAYATSRFGLSAVGAQLAALYDQLLRGAS